MKTRIIQDEGEPVEPRVPTPPPAEQKPDARRRFPMRRLSAWFARVVRFAQLSRLARDGPRPAYQPNGGS
jgi:hypothetical protein